jgi:hypothetical protein
MKSSSKDELQLAPKELNLAQVFDSSALLLNASAMLLEFVLHKTLDLAVIA